MKRSKELALIAACIHMSGLLKLDVELLAATIGLVSILLALEETR